MPLPKLIVADSESCADLLYATHFFAPDPFVFLEESGRRTILLSDLEIDRGRRTARVDEVLSWSNEESKVKGRRRTRPPLHDVLAAFLKSRKCVRVAVPADFPLRLARNMEKAGIRLETTDGSFWPERETKSDDEVRALRAALRMTEAGMARAFEVLRAANPSGDGTLRWGNAVLTSELLRAEADCAMLRAGALPKNSIVAGGDQACDPHERGSGPLRAGELIIIDLFPRSAESGYFGDLTRTVSRGRLSDARRHLWKTCLSGQRKALRAIANEVEGGALQEGIVRDFAAAGYPTEIRDGKWTGFFHGLGHGLGLEIHEAPRISAGRLRTGQVVTVEPGIYVPGLGGVRHEDVVCVGVDGNQVLSRCPKPMEL